MYVTPHDSERTCARARCCAHAGYEDKNPGRVGRAGGRAVVLLFVLVVSAAVADGVRCAARVVACRVPRQIRRLWVMGLATDYCVENSGACLTPSYGCTVAVSRIHCNVSFLRPQTRRLGSPSRSAGAGAGAGALRPLRPLSFAHPKCRQSWTLLVRTPPPAGPSRRRWRTPSWLPPECEAFRPQRRPLRSKRLRSATARC